MSFNKLDKKTEQAVMSAIEKIIDNSRHAPDADLNKIAADVFKETDGLTPQLVRRACEAYNKSKSVHTLQKRAADNRAEEFPLIDSDQVINQVYGYHKKAAGDFTLNPPALQENMLERLHEGLKKVASDDEKGFDIDSRAIERQIYRTHKDIEKQLERFHIKVASHREASENAMRRVCQIVRRLPKKQLNKVARLTINRYGEDGVRFMKIIGAFTDNEFPLQKTAAAAIFPLEEPYTSVTIAIDEARSHNHFGKMLEKVAEVGLGQAIMDANRLSAKAATVDALNMPRQLGGTMQGALKGVGDIGRVATRKLLDPLATMAKAPVIGGLTMEKKFDDGSKIFDPSLTNDLKALQAKQMFIDVATDDFTKDYPIQDTMQAYNNVVGAMPELVNDKYTPWVKALVREQLVQGNVADAATIKQLQDIGKEIKKGRTADIDEAVKQLEQVAGTSRPGMSEEAATAIVGGAPESGGGGGGGKGGGKSEGGISYKDVEELAGKGEKSESDRLKAEADAADKQASARLKDAKAEEAKRRTEAQNQLKAIREYIARHHPNIQLPKA